jgi:hypothetical protein
VYGTARIPATMFAKRRAPQRRFSYRWYPYAIDWSEQLAHQRPAPSSDGEALLVHQVSVRAPHFYAPVSDTVNGLPAVGAITL